jgi:hypothetical protein
MQRLSRSPPPRPGPSAACHRRRGYTQYAARSYGAWNTRAGAVPHLTLARRDAPLWEPPDLARPSRPTQARESCPTSAPAGRSTRGATCRAPGVGRRRVLREHAGRPSTSTRVAGPRRSGCTGRRASRSRTTSGPTATAPSDGRDAGLLHLAVPVEHQGEHRRRELPETPELEAIDPPEPSSPRQLSLGAWRSTR